MNQNNHQPEPSKISAEFAARLDAFGPTAMVRAIVLLQAAGPGPTGGRRQNAAQREAAVAAVRESATTALPAIDALLENFGGHRLADRPDALGALPVEATVAGIRALGASESVRAVLEDQQVHRIR